MVKRALHGVGLPPVRFLHREQIGALSLDMITSSEGGDTAIPEGCFAELDEYHQRLAGVPTERELDALRRCRLLCRLRTGEFSGRYEPRLRSWLTKYHTVEGECFSAVPGSSIGHGCRCTETY